MDEINKIDYIKEITSFFGPDTIKIKTIKEASELICQITKDFEHTVEQNFDNKKKISEEMADMYLMLESLKIIYNNEKIVNCILNKKIENKVNYIACVMNEKNIMERLYNND